MVEGQRKALRLWVVKDGDSSGDTPIPQNPPRRDESVGRLLAERRMERGETLATVSRTLRIPQSYLEALEQDHIAALPGRPFAIGFARTYAAYLGLDRDAVVEQVGRLAASVHRDPELRIHEAAPESRFPGSALVGASVIAAIVAYGFWYYDAAQQHVRRDLVSAVPPQMMASVDSNVRAAGDGGLKPKAPPAGAVASSLDTPTLATPSLVPPSLVSPPLINQPLVNQPLVNQPLVSGSLTSQPLVSQPIVGPGDLAQAPIALLPERTSLRPGEANAAAPLGAPERPAKGRIQLRAVNDSWIEVRNTDTGQVVANQILRTGATLTPPAGPGYKLTTGNAGGLEITVDGQPIPTMGNSGAVVRDIPLDADRLKAGYQPPPRR